MIEIKTPLREKTFNPDIFNHYKTYCLINERPSVQSREKEIKLLKYGYTDYKDGIPNSSSEGELDCRIVFRDMSTGEYVDYYENNNYNRLIIYIGTLYEIVDEEELNRLKLRCLL